MEIESLPLDKGCIARTLVLLSEAAYEVATYYTKDALDQVTFQFWAPLIGEYPYETNVYKLVPKDKPLSQLEKNFLDMVSVNDKYRRDLDLGDLYVSRSRTEDAAALEHQNVIDEFKTDEIILLTQDERAAVHGPHKVL